jgi:hypothetical protein
MSARVSAEAIPSRVPSASGQTKTSLAHAFVHARLAPPALLYLFCVMIPIGFNVGPLATTSLRLLMMVMLLPLTLRLLQGRYGRVILTDVLFFLHIGWALIALAVNNPTQFVQQTGSVGVEFLGGYLIGRAYVRTADDFVALCRWLVLLVLCTTPFAVFEALTGRPLIIEVLRRIQVAAVGIVTIEGRLGLERVQASFAHPIHYGLFCSVAFSLGFVALRGISSTLWRYITSAVVALSGFLALSSGALLAILLQIALISWAAVFSGFRRRWWLLVGLFVIAYIVIDIFSNRTPIRVFMSYATFSAHNAYWRSIIFEWGLKNLWGSPWFGIGLNDWVRPDFMHSGSMDNFWLVMAVRYGVPGFIFLAIGYVWSIFLVMRRNFDSDGLLAQIRRAWVFTFLGLSFTLTTVHVWTNVYSFVFFMFGSGIWLIAAASTERPANVQQKPRQAVSDDVRSQPPALGTNRGAPAYSRFSPQPKRQKPL